MADIELRKAERDFSSSPSNETLQTLATARVRYGLDLNSRELLREFFRCFTTGEYQSSSIMAVRWERNVDRGKVHITITIDGEYYLLDVNLTKLNNLAALFGTDQINVDEDDRPGCETCDYGSSYKRIFYIHDVKKNFLIPNLEPKYIEELESEFLECL